MIDKIAVLFRRVPSEFGRHILLPFMVTRLALFLVAWLGFYSVRLPAAFPTPWQIGVSGNREPVAAYTSPDIHPLVNMWARWDAGWYLDIAKSGYEYKPGQPSNSAFFPLYPVLTRIVHRVLFLPDTDYWFLVIGIALSDIFLLISLSYLRALLRLDYSDDVSSSCLFYILIFPTTFFLSSVYTESLFLALVVSAFYYARSNRWIFSCSLAGLAALTRSAGMIIAVPLFAEYLAQKNVHLNKAKWDLLAFLIIPAAVALFAVYLRMKFGSWTVIFDAQLPWGRRLMWPWHTFNWLIRGQTPFAAFNHDMLDFAFFLLLAMAAAVGLPILRLSYSVYAWTSLIFFSLWGMLGSVPRFVLAVFPMFLVFALLTANRSALRFALAILFSVLAGIFMVMFSQWNWVA